MNISRHQSGRFLLRAARPDDLPAFERFAADSAHGLTTLPVDGAALAERLRLSEHAFTTEDDASGEEIYLFVLEDLDRRELIGASGIAASAGFADRFYSFRNEFVVHASKPLGASNRIHTLHLCHDLTGVTLLTSFYIDPAYEQTWAPQLLSRGRLLFIAQFAERFSERIAAESPGLADDNGACPFWDAVGKRFFNMDYPSAERLAVGRSKSFIAELMPPSPVYVPLLPEEAQWAIGQLHPDAELPFSILLDEGFDPDSYVDVFDGGPTAVARVAMLKSIAASRVVRAAELSEEQQASIAIAATTKRNAFRAAIVQSREDGSALLGADDREQLRIAPLSRGREEDGR